MNALPEVDHYLIVGFDSDIELASQQLPALKVDMEPLLRREIAPVADLGCFFRLRSAVKHSAPEFVVTHQSKAGALGRLAAWSSGVPVVHSLSMASFGPGYSRIRDLVFRTVERALARITTLYLVVGEDLAARFAEVGVPSEKLKVVRSGIRLSGPDTDPRALKMRIGEQWGVSPDIPWLVHVGALEERKNVDLLPPLMSDIREALGEQPAHLFIVGAGPLRARVEESTAALDLTESITLTGHVDEALDYIRAAQVVLLLSSAEGMPQVLVQAAAVGTRFVAFEVEGPGELLRLGAEGAVVPPNGHSTFVDMVLRYSQMHEPASVIDVSSWSAETIRSKYRDLFRALP
ncbi:MAG: glycosyltransferase, partial [Acidimicrobiia bacterium]